MTPRSSDNELIEMFATFIGKMDLIGDLKTQVGILVNQMGILNDNHQKLTNVVLGNGKPGHVDRLNDLDVAVGKLTDWRTETQKKEEQQDADRRERMKEMRGLRITVIGALIIFVLTSLLNIGLSYYISWHEQIDHALATLHK